MTLHGTITASSVATPASVRVALVWQLFSESGTPSFRVAQELDVRAEFPASFRLDVRSLPPREAIHSVRGSVGSGGPTGFAYGTLVVYEDTNGNGQLDLLPLDATSSVDRVLGAPERLEIIYLEGGGIPKNPNAPPTDEDFVGHTPGFNLVFEPEFAQPEPGCSPCGPTALSAWTRLPVDGDITFALTADPRLSRVVCGRTGGDSATAISSCQPCVGEACAKCPIAQDAKVTCSVDGTAYVALSCASQSVCADLDCEYVSGRRDPAAPAPAGWPCR